VFATIMPPAVVHGMLAAIGVIIIAKQTPVALGAVSKGGEPLEMLAHIPSYIAAANPIVAAVGLLALGTLITMNLASRFAVVKRIPAPLVVLLLTVPLGAAFHFSQQHDYSVGGQVFTIGPKNLVQLPGSLLSAVTMPDFSEITSAISIKYIIMFALVGSVESLLSVLAVDSLDPQKRASNLDKDLLAVGVGNLIASAIGGLPMISEIVRSKANIDAGATNRMSNFFHGMFLLLFVALLPGLLQMIPLAALAAMLLFTGYRLASPKEFVHMWHVGKDQFALFFTTFAVTLATDLLVGVGVGILLKMVLHVVRSGGVRGLLRNAPSVSRNGEVLTVKIVGPAVFSTLLPLRRAIGHLPEGVTVVQIDLREATLVDFTFQEKLAGMADEWQTAKLQVLGLDGMKAASDHRFASRSRAA
jgi:MFS superfamily sulfate permease-like transporter